MGDALRDFRSWKSNVTNLAIRLGLQRPELERKLIGVREEAALLEAEIAELDASVAKLLEVSKVVNPKADPGEGPIDEQVAEAVKAEEGPIE